MSFASLDFIVILLAVLVLWSIIPPKWNLHFLLAASYGICTLWSWQSALLLLSVTTFVYFAILLSLKFNAKENAFTIAIIIILLLSCLVFFKYAAPELKTRWQMLFVPLGISYYTFKLISYVMDVHWKKMPVEKSYLRFSLSIAFFPQLLSGPIHRSRDFLEQLQTKRGVLYSETIVGLEYLLLGYVKKWVIADRLAEIINPVFSATGDYPITSLWLAFYLFPLQLYMDFSALTDMANGMARIFGIRGPENFRLPFFATNIQEFWRRWHITLSGWIADYVFTPLRMSMRYWGDVGLILAVMISMISIGIWHGASLHYIAFGFIQGVYVSFSTLTLKARNKWWKKKAPHWQILRNALVMLITYHLVAYSFIYFRCSTMHDVNLMLAGMLNLETLHQALNLRIQAWPFVFLLLFTALIEIIHWVRQSEQKVAQFRTLPRWMRGSAYGLMTVILLTYGMFSESEFIYFQF